MLEPNPAISKSRNRLGAVMRQAGGDVITVGDVSTALRLDRSEAAKVLARWNAQGWVKRLRRGYYAPVPLDMQGQEQVLEDPWVMVPELFGEACIGGWSAAEHWGLTEQLFRSTCVLTTKPVQSKELTIQGLPFTLKHVKRDAFFSTRAVWRARARVLVTTPEKTIVDMLDDPALGGGIRHVADCLGNYFTRDDADSKALIATADKLGNGAVFKRLGFLAETLRGADAIVDACRTRLSSGNAKLDPAISCRRLVTRWRLWVPASWTKARRT